ncbi:SDR family NAD(P)-dependent oxidoreductase [Parabacteroides sp. ZJ-118]|uniref:SDR family NAD(P)-dependent oxidoreductase n=1 Tax=Parabacteroides sp. ZJ-118 TaxID=2709398 RepID=UPI0013EADD47|nr:SDR family oxidoreductase [Parabacteroides sp. ZJ-118]
MSETFNPFSLEGKTILVTGASSGIGRSIAIVASKMGATVVITARNQERLEQTLSQMSEGSHKIISADVTATEDIDKISTETPALDGIVHCAGVGRRLPLKMVQEKDVEFAMATNFKAPVLLQRTLLKKKKVHPGASIVFIASRAPFAPTVGNGLYAASKGAIIAYAKVLGLELSNQLIRVNCICPAMVWTDLVQRDAEVNGVDYHELEKSYPLKRYGQPSDVANLTVYLLSDASCWMTGSCIDITGGASSL